METLRELSNSEVFALGRVDKVDSQISYSMIQDCFLGGSHVTWRSERSGMDYH